MIKTSLKNFFKNLLYLFIPMGIVYLFLLFALLLFLASFLSNLGGTIGAVGELVHVASGTSSEAVNEFLSYAVGELDMSGGLLATIRQILDTNWLQNTFVGFFRTLDESTEGFGESLAEIIGAFKSDIIADFALSVSLVALGVLLANFATRYVLRSQTIRHSFKKFFIAHLLLPGVQWLLMAVFFLLLAVIRLYSLLALVGLVAFSAILSLFSAWFIHRDGNIKLKDILTGKNILAYFGVIIIFLLLVAAVTVALFFLNPIFAILFLVPFAIYALNIVDANTESYLCSLVAAKKRS